ncbi:hypothetical protein CONPUDRAFT_137821 [Coniophora puteana RWD-64-598 SS2]|uniref:Uncharacterized protein n=1 Tax=Coniophora puteana (strain RWD-64-598) TaxID=741705 RepID=A0A5M3MK55_CONPW|nr:uncharacterized protein CONPUDRAFT_137821 [Coniophora puteana RWD-64-598 SS2]EIW79443.1 hypothetical protein CONPUDRAFT_137821 [Coniophora puteana RWD-64-598 SS2]
MQPIPVSFGGAGHSPVFPSGGGSGRRLSDPKAAAALGYGQLGSGVRISTSTTTFHSHRSHHSHTSASSYSSSSSSGSSAAAVAVAAAAVDAYGDYHIPTSLCDAQLDHPKTSRRHPKRSGIPHAGAHKRPSARRMQSDHGGETALRTAVSKLIAVKARPFTVSGQIPLDPTTLVLFFRSKSGITHSLDFPVDVDYDTPPALDVLISACQSTPIPDAVDSFYYPSQLPLTATVEIANHPITDALRNTLFPLMPPGTHLIAVRDRLEVTVAGGDIGPQSAAGILGHSDGRIATVVVTLPIRFTGGALVVRDAADSNEERFGGRSEPGEDDEDDSRDPDIIEWTAFLAECSYEVERVNSGCRMCITYGIHARSFGAGPGVEPLIGPSDRFLDCLSQVLNLSRGRKIAFHLTQEYVANPEDALAETLVPQLKGSDSILYHALKIYKLAPELHWAAGDFIWPIDRAVDTEAHDGSDPTSQLPSSVPRTGTTPPSFPVPALPTPVASPLRAIRHPFSPHSDVSSLAEDFQDGLAFGSPTDSSRDGGFRDHRDGFRESRSDRERERESRAELKRRMMASGAVPLDDAEITIASDWAPGPITKLRVPFVSGASGELGRLVVNVLLATYVP